MYIFEQKHVQRIQLSLTPALQNFRSLILVPFILWSNSQNLSLVKKPKRKAFLAFARLTLRPISRFGVRVAAFFAHSNKDILHHRRKKAPLNERISSGDALFAHHHQTRHFPELCFPQEAVSCVIENSMPIPIKLNP